MPLLDLYSLWLGPPGPPPPVVVVSPIAVLYQADILIDGIAASTEGSRIRLRLVQATKEATAFGDPARWYKPGIYAVEANGVFYYQTGNQGRLLANKLIGVTQGPSAASAVPLVVTICADTSVGSLANIWRGVNAEYAPHAVHGEVISADVSTYGAGDGRCVQGRRLLRAQQAATSGLGTAVQLGPVAAGQRLYSALHVVGTTGTPAGTTFALVSAAASDLVGATQRVQYVAGTSDVAGEWQELAAPVTDTWWAARWSGFSGGAFTASISAGIE